MGNDPSKRGVVAVVSSGQQLLVIQRSRHVVAPGAFCFPGGGIEMGESESDALCREFQEELNAPLRPLRQLWTSVTPWNVELAWWAAELPDGEILAPNPREVEAFQWATPEEITLLPNLLVSNLHFLDAWRCGEFELTLAD